MADRALEVVAEIQRIARNELELEREVRPEDDLLADLQLDSMSLTVLAVALEDKYRVKLDDPETLSMRTVGQLAELIARRTGGEAC